MRARCYIGAGRGDDSEKTYGDDVGWEWFPVGLTRKRTDFVSLKGSVDRPGPLPAPAWSGGS